MTRRKRKIHKQQIDFLPHSIMQIATPLQICMKWNKLTASRKSVSCPLSLNIKQLNIDQDAAAQPFILINYGCTAYLQSSSRFICLQNSIWTEDVLICPTPVLVMHKRNRLCLFRHIVLFLMLLFVTLSNRKNLVNINSLASLCLNASCMQHPQLALDRLFSKIKCMDKTTTLHAHLGNRITIGKYIF